ncbi:MAG: response regulator transcription factor [Planctomycetota bacterium]|jgi:DNA-binding NarL/FixJ family response regulator
MTLTHDLFLITSFDIDRSGLASILDTSMRYKLHTLRPNRINSSLFEGTDSSLIGMIDAELFDADPIAVASELSEYRPGIPLLFVARSDSPQLFLRGLQCGVLGVVQKTESPGDILRKLDAAVRKQNLWNKEELRRYQACFSTGPSIPGLETPFTLRESDVLSKLAVGLTNRRIAEELGISYETVKEHVQHILRKVGVTDRTQAAVWAVRNRLF